MNKLDLVETEHEILLTTVDNPFNPFSDFRNWYLYDCSKGYCTNALMDRIMQEENKNSDFNSLNEKEKDELIVKIIAKLLPDLYKIVENDTQVYQIPITNIE